METDEAIARLRRGYESFNRGDLEAVLEDFDDYHFEPHEFHVEGDHIVVVARQSATGRLSGVPVEGEIVHAWLIEEDRVAGLRAFSTLEEALEAIRADAGERA